MDHSGGTKKLDSQLPELCHEAPSLVAPAVTIKKVWGKGAAELMTTIYDAIDVPLKSTLPPRPDPWKNAWPGQLEKHLHGSQWWDEETWLTTSWTMPWSSLSSSTCCDNQKGLRKRSCWVDIYIYVYVCMYIYISQEHLIRISFSLNLPNHHVWTWIFRCIITFFD